MKPNRPVNLDLGAFAFPLPAKASILHRITGVALVVGVGILLYLLDVSLSGEAGYARAGELLASTPAKLVIWAVLAALIYHCVAGVRHLLMDVGIGESLAGGITTARITFAVSGVLIVMAGVWVW